MAISTAALAPSSPAKASGDRSAATPNSDGPNTLTPEVSNDNNPALAPNTSAYGVSHEYDASAESSASPPPTKRPAPRRTTPTKPAVTTDSTPTYAPPVARCSLITNHPYGVMTGSALLDMTTYLSRTRLPSDWALSHWLEQHYIAPFGYVNRLDGIVVQNAEDMCMLMWAHQNYCVVNPMPVRGLPPQCLWVPGLEPLRENLRGGVETEEPLWEGAVWEWKVWDASEMERSVRRGVCLGGFEDGMGWERELWRL